MNSSDMVFHVIHSTKDSDAALLGAMNSGVVFGLMSSKVLL